VCVTCGIKLPAVWALRTSFSTSFWMVEESFFLSKHFIIKIIILTTGMYFLLNEILSGFLLYPILMGMLNLVLQHNNGLHCTVLCHSSCFCCNWKSVITWGGRDRNGGIARQTFKLRSYNVKHLQILWINTFKYILLNKDRPIFFLCAICFCYILQ